jgi:hypothetical protein
MEDRGQEHLARVNDRSVQAADRHDLAALQLVPRVENEHDEVFALRAAQVTDVAQHVLGARESASPPRAPPARAGRSRTPRECGRPRGTDARDASPAGERPARELGRMLPRQETSDP